MYALIKNLIFSSDNIIEVALSFSHLLNIKITDTSLRKEIEEHPDYPSMLAITDVFSNYGFKTLAAKVKKEQLKELETPYITQIRITKEGISRNYYTIVKEAFADKFNYFDPDKKSFREIDHKSFNSICSGVVLYLEAEEGLGEKDFDAKRKKEKGLRRQRALSLLVIPIIIVFLGATIFIDNGIKGLFPFLNLCLTFSGLLVSILLLWYDIDSHNPALLKICKAGKKTNCSAILQSDASGIFGISWSEIGFTYFCGYLMLFMISLMTGSAFLLSILSWLSLLASSYIIYSIYYQWQVAKQWCVLCLIIQAALGLQAILCLVNGWYKNIFLNELDFHAILLFVMAFAIPFLVSTLGMPALRKAKEGKQSRMEHQRFKHDTDVFNSLLIKQKQIENYPVGLGLHFGDINAKNRILKVCNPYCTPCSKAHADMESLLENNHNVQLQIIYSAIDDERDIKSLPIKHFMAIADQKDEAVLKQALNDWYNAPKKDYIAFSEKYKMNGELNIQGEKLSPMQNWCEEMDIQFTPTLFLNGYQLPKTYSVKDLKYLLLI